MSHHLVKFGNNNLLYNLFSEKSKILYKNQAKLQEQCLCKDHPSSVPLQEKHPNHGAFHLHLSKHKNVVGV